MSNKHDIFIGRQPIYNANLGVYGYELLFQKIDFFNPSDDQIHSQNIINTFIEFGLDNLTGTRNACINPGKNNLLWHSIPRIHTDKVLLNISSPLSINSDFINALKQLHNDGFMLAIYNLMDTPGAKPIMPYINIIRVDVTNKSSTDIFREFTSLKKYNKKILAENIKQLDEYEAYSEMGFDYFQGYFLSRPKIIKNRSLSSNRLSVMNLIAAVNSTDNDIDKIESIINRDISLSYKILKLVNSASFATASSIDSIKHAIIMLGRKQLISWATMMALSKLDNRPSEMLHLSMVRAKTCELIADAANLSSKESYFTTGLFSALDILMEQPIHQLIKSLPLTSEISDALAYRKGLMGEALNTTLAFELSDWKNVQFSSLTKADLISINIEAFKWAREVTRSIN